MAESEEVKQALTALQAAIKVLSDATTGIEEGQAKRNAAQTMEGTGLIQEKVALRMKYAVRNVLDKLPSTVSSNLRSDSISLLSEFTKDVSRYAPQSATIQGMLKDMYTTFAMNLQEATMKEAIK